MKSWTRTLNLDDAHTLLAEAAPGIPLDDWTAACHAALPDLSLARRRELIRLLRDGFLEWNDDGTIEEGTFLRFYGNAPATAQIDLVNTQWALSHPITLQATRQVVEAALERDDTTVTLAEVESLVAKHLDTRSAESLRKTRTVLLGALEGIGTLVTRGTGQHRQLRAARGCPHPLTFGYLAARDLSDRQLDAMMQSEVAESSLGVRLTQCTYEHAQFCTDWCLERQVLVSEGDEVRLGTYPSSSAEISAT